VYAGYSIPPYYDSMVAKVITHGETREEAIQRMERALKEFHVVGIKTTIPFHLNLLSNKTFISGDFNTKFLELHDLKTKELQSV
jgi:acetyl-CoA carboxylase biotin carboxylase subunit